MSPIAIDPEKEIEYILKVDRDLPEDDSNRTVWILRPLSARKQAAIEDRMAEGKTRKEGGGIKLKVGSQILDILDVGLVGVRNFRLANGQELTLPDNKKARQDFYTFIRGEWRSELADVITEGSVITEEEVKN